MNIENKKKKVLFICTHNSARSQLAEGLLNHSFSQDHQGFSAGTEATAVRPQAIAVMAEIGCDISHYRSKTVHEFEGIDFDYVITVCDNAKETCPYFPGARAYIHKSFKDPSSVEGTEEDKLQAFRNTREEIKAWLEDMFR